MMVKMKLHDEISVDDITTALRVYEGWIYKFHNKGGVVCSTQFVPDTLVEITCEISSIPDDLG